MTENREETARIPSHDPRDTGMLEVLMSAGAHTPEDLETLFEDVLMLRDPAALVELFEEGAALVAGDAPPVRGGQAIARSALLTWGEAQPYIADPRRVVQARDIALIVGDHGINVARRGHDGAWRYAIVLLSTHDGTVGSGTGRREP